MPNFFYLKSDRFPVVSVLNKFMKMHSNTISIVHSNFRRKESLYLFIQALFLSWPDTGFRDLQFSFVFPAKNVSSTLIMRLFGLEIRIYYSVRVEAMLLIPASPWPWCSRPCYASSIVGSTAGNCGDQGAGRPGQGTKPFVFRLCALARISKIMIPLNPLDDLLPSFWTIFTHLVTSPWSQLAYMCCNRVLPP